MTLSKSVLFAFIAANISCAVASTKDVKLVFACEFSFTSCCKSAFAAAQLAVADSNDRNGAVVPELGLTTRSVRMQISLALDTSDANEAVLSLRREIDQAVDSSPVAVIGSYWSSRVLELAQTCNALGLSQLAWCSSPAFENNEAYSGVLRLLPHDGQKMLAVHGMLRTRGIADIAVVYTRGDAWSEQCLASLKRACDGSSKSVAVKYACVVFPFPVSLTATESELYSVLENIASSGVRTILNVQVSETAALDLVRHAKTLKMTGRTALSKGYLWLHGWDILNDAPARDGVWDGHLAIVLPTQSVRPSKASVIKSHWNREMPSFPLMSVPGAHLSMEQALDPSDCLMLVSGAYDAVARVRQALEIANLSSPALAQPKASWLGREVLNVLQSPGVSIGGLLQGPEWRKSVAPGKMWIENDAEMKIINYPGQGKTPLEVFVAGSNSILNGSDFANVVLPGAVVGFQADTGMFQPSPCNGKNANRCGDFGICQVNPSGIGRSEGWCKCDHGFLGRFCDIRSSGLRPPSSSESVPVEVQLEVLKFGGLTKDGESFNADIRLNLTWEDQRFAYDGGKYTESFISQLRRELWLPEVIIEGIEQRVFASALSVKRPSDQAELSGNETKVVLTLSEKIRVQEEFKADFRRFPFDKHMLKITFKSKQPSVELKFDLSSDVNLVPLELLEMWNGEWPPDYANNDGGTDWMHVQAHEAKRNAYVLTMKVRRAVDLNTIRILVPCCVLVMISWGGFWIKPAALMPRFASGFISFLSLQGFKTHAIQLMPNGGLIQGISWIDIFISFVGILMGLSVAQTVSAQYINERTSQQVSLKMDRLASWAFPTVFIIGFILMLSLQENLLVALALTHSMIFVFALSFAAYTWYLSHYFARVFFRMAIRQGCSAAERHKIWALTEPELKRLFDELDGLDKDRNDGLVNVDDFVSWLLVVLPFIKERFEHRVRLVVSAVFKGQSNFNFPEFKQHIQALIYELVFEIHREQKNEIADDEHVDDKSTVEGVVRRQTTSGSIDPREVDKQTSLILNRVSLRQNAVVVKPRPTVTAPEEEDDEDNH
eukprot:TRINITY_DN23076_c0_g1_i2.p1 TRINITY_DN23076_c0_g1~~TRINITY_DN23076_c0_g1_i2.p1  ORF type:complete len:1061 (-),score=111.17 TRINITY_DN23076_c0_g1_i2:215-3397(-)